MADLRDMVYAITFEMKDKTLDNVAKKQDEIDKKFNKISSSTDKVNKKLKDSKSNVEGISGKVSKLDSGVKTLFKSIAGAYAIRKTIDLGKQAINVFAEFEQGMANVRATMGQINDTDFERLKKAAIEGGSTTVYTSAQAAEALNYMALAGFKVDEAVSALPTVLDLAAGGGLDLARSSDIITDSMSALSLEVKDLNTFADQLAKTSQTTNTDVNQLGTAIITVGGLAKSANMDTQALNTQLGILANSGYKGAKGGTALRNVLLNLTAPTSEVSMLLEDLGVRVADKTTGQIRDLNDILIDLREKLGKYTQAQQNAILATIGEKQNVQALRILLKGAGDEYENLKTTIENSNGAAEQMADTQRDTVRGAITEMESAVQGAIITVLDSGTAMEGLKDKLKDVAGQITTIIETIQMSEKEPIMVDLYSSPQRIPADFPNVQAETETQIQEAQKTVDKWSKRIKNTIRGGVIGGFTITGAKVGTAIAPGLGTLVGGLIGAVSGAVVGFWPEIKQFSTETKEEFKEMGKEVAEWASGVKYNWNYMVNGMAETAKQNIDDVTELLFGFRRKFANFKPIQLIQNPIEAAYEASKTGQLPQDKPMVPWKGSDPLDLLPKFATGTNNTPDTFIAGDKGPEIVTGAKNHKVFSNRETQSLFGGSGVYAPVSIKIDGADKNKYEIAQEVKRELDNYFETLNEQMGFAE